MPRGRKPGRQAEKTHCRLLYLLELARGSSYVASTLTPESQHAAIAEVLREFSQQHDADKLPMFRELLAERLQERGDLDAAQAVLSFRLRQ
ncbi:MULTISPECIES: hypothetical protein [Burkholderiaceae]|uniref:hypothetical protein n=1 Tax=Burkholderiaceae TaxID=119060 RepID=UPI00141E0665|nr:MULTISPECIES: hypothetical protein [Burkholderiaceae]MBN3847266.1 hypothetical protein [Paraburkholderia sp. Ac-20342]NIF51319.1 hypothetical protein [Burkholderia sp. Ax-1724]